MPGTNSRKNITDPLIILGELKKRSKMKTVLTRFMVLGSASLLLLAACKKNDPIITTNGGTPGTLTANVTSLVLDKTKLNDTTKVISFHVSKPNFGFAAAATSTFQIDPVGDNWAKPTSVTLGNGVYSGGYSTADFNNLLLKLNLPAGTASQVQARIVFNLGGAAKPIYSNVLNITATPFNLTSWLWVTGEFAGWANSKSQTAEDSLVSVTGNGIYTGVINFPQGKNQFLILPVKGDWTHKYATNDAQGSTSSTVTYDASNNLYAPAAGGPTIVTFNANNGTITFQAANSYSIIGSATPNGNWSTDLFLKYINDGTNTWTGTFPLLAGQFKFRQNADWSFSWGNVSPANGTDLTDSNGGNIDATAGTHTVSFIIPLTAQGSGAPSVTATYSLH